MNAHRFKILIISDHLANAAYFEKTITNALQGTKVYITQDKIQAVELAKSKEPDVILIDLSLKNEDSLKISRMIKKDKALHLTPILFVTDFEADRNLRTKAIKAGAEAFLLKPIDDSILITQLIAMAKIKERNILINAQNKQLEFLVAKRTSDLENEIVDRIRLEMELRKSEEIFKTYIEKAPIGIFVTDALFRFVEANSMACQLTGFSKEEILKLSLADYITPTYLDNGLIEFQEFLNEGFIEKEYRVKNKNNQEYWISLRATKINDDCYIAFCVDISDRKEKEVRVAYLSFHDSLTGIYNRAYYADEVTILDTKENLPFSVIISDINGLKLTNDTMGHTAGDKVLIEMSRILKLHLRSRDVLARVGGDEFSILLPQTSNQEAQEIVNAIQASCQENTLDLLDVPIKISISLGIATKTKFEESFSHISKLAEDQMYRSKLLDRESFHNALLESLRISLYERSHETEEHATRLMHLSTELGTAMGLSKEDLNDLALLSSLHDIGKLSIDNRILDKPGKLTDTEWLEMKKHPAIGYRIAMASTELRPIAENILCHHEHWNGTGYPQGLSGENIPLLSRVISVVDAYDAMTNDRTYRKALTKEAAIAEINYHTGSQFDPQIAALFLTLI